MNEERVAGVIVMTGGKERLLGLVGVIRMGLVGVTGLLGLMLFERLVELISCGFVSG